MLAAADSSGEVWVWSVDSGALLRTLTPDSISLESGQVAWTPDGSQIVESIWYPNSETSALVVWGVASGKSQRELRGQEGRFTSLAWKGDTGLLGTGSEDGSVWLWDISQGQAVTSLTSETPAPILDISFSRGK